MFYEELKLKLQGLIAQNNFPEALKIITEELSMPYLPLDFETYLQETKMLILNLTNDQRKVLATLTPEEIKTKLCSRDLVEQNLAIQELKSTNVRLFLPEIEKFLTNPHFLNENKTLLLLILEDQQVTKPVFLTKNQQTWTVVPSEIKSQDLLTDFQLVQELMEKKLEGKNPSLTKNLETMTLVFLLHYFPERRHWEIHDLTAALIKKGTTDLGAGLTWEEIAEKFSFNFQNTTQIYQLLEEL